MWLIDRLRKEEIESGLNGLENRGREKRINLRKRNVEGGREDWLMEGEIKREKSWKVNIGEKSNIIKKIVKEWNNFGGREMWRKERGLSLKKRESLKKVEKDSMENKIKNERSIGGREKIGER